MTVMRAGCHAYLILLELVLLVARVFGLDNSNALHNVIFSIILAPSFPNRAQLHAL